MLDGVPKKYLLKKKIWLDKICIIVILGTGTGFDILLIVVTFNVHLISAIFRFKLFYFMTFNVLQILFGCCH